MCTPNKQFAEVQTNIAHEQQYCSVMQAKGHANVCITLTVTVSTE
jgi:hypothetical protein